ncbi:MAG: pseudouridine synthase [Bacteroidota bacterium]
MEILFEDNYLVAVNKPEGMLVHKTKIAADVKTGFALQTVRDQVGKKVFPVHRLDRPTSGVLLFAFNPITANSLMTQFDQKTIRKQYRCVVRGFTETAGSITEPLMKENGNFQESQTDFELIEHFELPIANSRFDSTRYSILKVAPKTGRTHQIRRHFAKKRHYLIGDTKYGDLKSNRAFQEYSGINGLMLHAESISFTHPDTRNEIAVTADLPPKFHKLQQLIVSVDE